MRPDAPQGKRRLGWNFSEATIKLREAIGR